MSRSAAHRPAWTIQLRGHRSVAVLGRQPVQHARQAAGGRAPVPRRCLLPFGVGDVGKYRVGAPKNDQPCQTPDKDANVLVVSATEHHSELSPFRLVVLVGSLGGLAATSTVLAGLPREFPVPLLVVQHGRRSTDPDRLTRLLDNATALPVHTACHGVRAYPAGVTVIPGGTTATVDDACRLWLTDDGNGLACGDSLLRGAAATVGPATIGVVLTGMLCDGTEGVRAIKRRGGRVLAQDPATARAPGMPSSAIATGCVDFVLPLERIAPALIALTMAPGAADLLTVPSPPWAKLYA